MELNELSLLKAETAVNVIAYLAFCTGRQLSYSQGKEWKRHSFGLGRIHKPFSLYIVYTGYWYLGSIALDDIRFVDCAPNKPSGGWLANKIG